MVLIFSAAAARPAGAGDSAEHPRCPPLPLKYRIGTIDSRFDLTKERLLITVQEAAGVWEAAAGRSLFVYDERATLPVNVVFSDAERRVIDARPFKDLVDATDKSYHDLLARYDAETPAFDSLNNAYAKAVQQYNFRLARYNNLVVQWNSAGGVPEEMMPEMNAKRALLDSLFAIVQKDSAALHTPMANRKALGDRIEDAAHAHNVAAAQYDGHFTVGKEFEAGTASSNEINVYVYQTLDELRLVLVHELGHALGFGHTKDSLSVMFPVLLKQNTEHIQLSPADLDLVRSIPGSWSR
jgi:hypothetical protein